MKKLFATFVAGLFSLSALAQTFPSPTFNSVTLQNPLTAANGGTGATSSTGTGSVVLSNSPTLTGTPIVPGYLTSASAAATYAPLVSPAFTGAPTAPNAAAGTNTTQLATTAFVLGSLGAPPNGIGSTTPSAGAFTTLSSTAAPTVGATTIYPTVPTNAALQALSTATVSTVTRLGFAAVGDVSPLTYKASSSACSLNSGAGDNGSQVKSSDSKCWLAQFPAAGIDVLEFGAKGDGSLDSTTAINAAVAAAGVLGGGTVRFSPTTLYYLVSGPINLTGRNITLYGGNSQGTLIQSTSTTASIINNTGPTNRIQGLSLGYATSPTSGSTIFSSGSSFTGTDFTVINGFNDLEVTAASGNMFSQFFLYNYSNYGFYMHSANDAYLSQFIFNTSISSGTGIRLFNQVEALNATDGDVLGGSYGLTSDATTYSIGTRPAYNSFQGVYFDSGSTGGAFLNNSVLFDFTNCWFSAGRSGSGGAGVLLSNTDEMSFTNSKFFNNGGPGASVSATSKRTVFTSNKFESNSETAGSGVSHGLVFAPGTTDFVVQGNVAHNGLYTGVQGWGIIVNTGASDRYVIQNNLVSGNATGGVADGGTGTNKNVANNY